MRTIIFYPFRCPQILESHEKNDWPRHQTSWLRGKVGCPVLLLNADDDMLCVKENVDAAEHLVDELAADYVLARTPVGSHVAFNEGALGTGNFMHRATLDFFDAVRVTKGERA